MAVTRHYLVGEMSVLLGELAAVASHQTALEAARLRREAETGPPNQLGCVAVRALSMGRALSWEALESGDMVEFSRRAAMCSELHDFCVSAGLLEFQE